MRRLCQKDFSRQTRSTFFRSFFEISTCFGWPRANVRLVCLSHWMAVSGLQRSTCAYSQMQWKRYPWTHHVFVSEFVLLALRERRVGLRMLFYFADSEYSLCLQARGWSQSRRRQSLPRASPTAAQLEHTRSLVLSKCKVMVCG